MDSSPTLHPPHGGSGHNGVLPSARRTLPAPTAPCFWHELPNAPAVGAVLGHLDALPDGQATMSTLEANANATVTGSPAAPPFRILLLRSGQEVKAYVNRCAHFGVPLAARQDQLLFQAHVSISCNVHYARYRWQDGVCERGDCAGESLLAIPVRVNAQGEICIAPASTDTM